MYVIVVPHSLFFTAINIITLLFMTYYYVSWLFIMLLSVTRIRNSNLFFAKCKYPVLMHSARGGSTRRKIMYAKRRPDEWAITAACKYGPAYVR